MRKKRIIISSLIPFGLFIYFFSPVNKSEKKNNNEQFLPMYTGKHLIAEKGESKIFDINTNKANLKDSNNVNSVQLIVDAGKTEGTGDVARLKHLASGVGWEFSPNGQTTAELKRIGIKTIRCINIEPISGHFNADGSYFIDKQNRLLSQLNTCRAIGANPHLCIATALSPALRSKDKDIQSKLHELMGNKQGKYFFGPTDWSKFRNYYMSLFKYVLIDQGFPNASFEVGNEPDVKDIFVETPPRPQVASERAYEAYLKVYSNIAQAATEFEKENPGLKVQLGGPALAWAYTFKYGAFNWSERFIKDVGERKLKCDFIGLHYYGNVSSQNDEFEDRTYPSFVKMLNAVRSECARYMPNTPIWITEWGPSYRTDHESSVGDINGNQIGAAWSAAFLSTMLDNKIDGALFLVTTDLQKKSSDGKMEDDWNWPSLFVNPNEFNGKAYPKPIFHVFDMVSRLSGERISIKTSGNYIGDFGCEDEKSKTIKIMLWNYHSFVPENGPAIDQSIVHTVNIVIKDLPEFLRYKNIKISRWQISKDQGNAMVLNNEGVVLNDKNTAMQVEDSNTDSNSGVISYKFRIPPSGVCLVEFSAI